MDIKFFLLYLNSIDLKIVVAIFHRDKIWSQIR